MKVIYDILKIKRGFVRPIAAIGVFDGLHLGHRCLIKQVVQRARKIRGTSVVVTFFPHPAYVLNPKAPLPLLATLDERIRLIGEMGVDVCVVINFTKKFSQLKPGYFIEKYLVGKMAPLEVFVGHDFRFGNHRQGDFRLLQMLSRQYHFKAFEIPVVRKDGFIISSTRIRKLISSGNLRGANRQLGRNVSVFGRVKRGDGRGKLLGFPTANIHVISQTIPPRGVYIVRVIFRGKRYSGMANVGTRPSFYQTEKITVETHIFHFKQSIYGKMITVEFLKKIREEKKFHIKSTLISQLKRDKKQALRYFQK